MQYEKVGRIVRERTEADAVHAFLKIQKEAKEKFNFTVRPFGDQFSIWCPIANGVILTCSTIAEIESFVLGMAAYNRAVEYKQRTSKE